MVDDLSSISPEEMHRLLWRASASYRLQHNNVLIDGFSKIDFKRYPYLTELIDGRARYTTVLKGAQMGFTVSFIMRILEDLRSMPLRGVLYLFPTDGEVVDFSKARFSPMVQANPCFQDLVDKTDASGLKKIGRSFVYFRGLGQRGSSTADKSTSKLKSIPVDHIYYDEADEMDPARLDTVEYRLDGSECPEETKLSTPTVPEFGVDLAYKDSDQRSWHWKCGRCGQWTCLDDMWPDCIADVNTGEPYFLCSNKRCGRLERDGGEWVVSNSEVRDHRGYWISQLNSPTQSAENIIYKYDRAIKRGRLKEFYNQTLARAYIDAEDELTEQQLNDCLTREPPTLRHPGPTAMGVDPGKLMHWQVRIRVSDLASRVLAWGEAHDYETINNVASKFNVSCGVMDQGADTTAVRNFIHDHPGWYGCLYVESKRTDPDWDHKTRTVKVGRNYLLDLDHQDIMKKKVLFPTPNAFWHETVVPQMTNLKRAEIEKADTGERKYKWIVTGGRKNDHLRHASAYARLACDRVSVAGEYIPTRKHPRHRRRRSAMTM